MATNIRALIHASSIFVPILAEAVSRPVVLAALCLVTVAYVAEESIRLRGGSVPLISSFTLKMSHVDERDHFISKPVFLAAGIITVLLIFPRNVAYASIAIVAIGDPVAAYVGGKFGRSQVGRRTWEGFAAGTCVAFAPTLLLVPPIIGAIGSIVGMLLELIGILDDNLTIPIGSGIAMFLATLLLPPVAV